MNYNFFVKKLKQLAPGENALRGLALSDDFIKQFQESYICLPKEQVNADIFATDSLVELLSNYDCSKVEIGIVRFLDSPLEDINYYEIGRVDLDILSVDKITKEVRVLDHDSKDHVIWNCASNGDNFLDALLFCAENLTNRIINLSEAKSQGGSFESISHCADLAGGKSYINFYEMLLQ